MSKVVGMAVCAAVFAATVLSGEYSTLAVTGHDVSLTNTQKNASWEVDGVLFKFTALPAPGSTVAVSRLSGGVEYLLSSSTNTAASMWWYAEGAVTFKKDDALWLSCGGATGTVQVMKSRRE